MATKKAAAPEQPVPAQAGISDLDAFITEHERAAQDIGQVVTAISYPGAVPRLHPGVYSGFPVTDGELSATYSDGSKH